MTNPSRWPRIRAFVAAIAIGLLVIPVATAARPGTSGSIRFVSPLPGAAVSGTIQVRVEAARALSVLSVDLSLDGLNLARASSLPLSYALDTSKVSAGAHTLTAVATSKSGVAIAQTRVTVTPTTTPPSAGMPSPPTPESASVFSASAFYVAPSGSDGNPGTQSAPWKTIQKALDTLAPGQTAYVRQGTYSSWLTMSRSGTAGAPISLLAYPGERPLIDGRFKITGSHFVLAGFVFQGPTGPRDVEIYITGSPTNVVVRNNEIRDTTMSGVFISGGSGIQIINNWIHDIGTTMGQDHGVYWDTGSGTVGGNLIVGSIGYGVHLYPNADGVTVTQNTVVDSSRSGILVAGTTGQSSDDNLVVNNVVAYNDELGIRTYWNGTIGQGNVARNNVVWGNVRGNLAGHGLTFLQNATVDPGFAGAASYELRADSPAVDAATVAPTLSVDMRDRARRPLPDIGAFER